MNEGNQEHQAEGRRNGNFALLVHSAVDYAMRNIQEDKETVMEHLIKETSFIIDRDLKNSECKYIHGWLYANAVDDRKVHEFIDLENKLAVCGDWCAGGRIEGAFKSAYNLAAIFKTKIF